MRIWIPTAFTLLLTGCAASPHKIAATPYSEPDIEAQACDVIIPRAAATDAELLRLVKIQGERRARGAGELLAFGLTANMFEGDKEAALAAEIGRLKGQRIALRAEAAKKGCALPESHKILLRMDAAEQS